MTSFIRSFWKASGPQFIHWCNASFAQYVGNEEGSSAAACCFWDRWRGLLVVLRFSSSRALTLMGRPNRLIKPWESDLVVNIVFAKGCDFLANTASRGLVTPALMILPLYSLSLTSPVTVCWVRVDKRGERLAQRGVPLAVVHQLCKLDGNLLFVMLRIAVQADGFQRFVCAW